MKTPLLDLAEKTAAIILAEAVAFGEMKADRITDSIADAAEMNLDMAVIMSDFGFNLMKRDSGLEAW